MKILTTLFLTFALSICSAQKKSDQKADSLHFKITLTELEQMTIQDNEALERQIKIEVDKFQQAINIRREEFQKFLNRLYTSRKIPMDRLVENGDSLKVGSNEITGILKPKNK